jgi:hypothetical protein
MSKNHLLGHLEYDVLCALVAFPEENYGAALSEQMARPQGTITTTLHRLEAKSLVLSTWEEAPRDIKGARSPRWARMPCERRRSTSKRHERVFGPKRHAR